MSINMVKPILHLSMNQLPQSFIFAVNIFLRFYIKSQAGQIIYDLR